MKCTKNDKNKYIYKNTKTEYLHWLCILHPWLREKIDGGLDVEPLTLSENWLNKNNATHICAVLLYWYHLPVISKNDQPGFKSKKTTKGKNCIEDARLQKDKSCRFRRTNSSRERTVGLSLSAPVCVQTKLNTVVRRLGHEENVTTLLRS